MDELINLRNYLETLVKPDKYSSADDDYTKGIRYAYNNIIHAIDDRMSMIEYQLRNSNI